MTRSAGRKLMRRLLLLGSFALVLATLASAQQSPAAAGQLPSKATVESFLRHWFSYEPNLQFEVGEIAWSEIPGVAQVVATMGSGNDRKNMVLYVMPDGQHAMIGEVIPFGADPFSHTRALLAKSTTGISRGPDHATVTIYEFSDLQCPHCKQAQPVVDRLLGDLPDLRFVFQQFPLEMAHPWAYTAAEWAQCIGRENNQAFWKFVQGVYNDQLGIDTGNVAAKMREHATAAGASADQAAACVAKPPTGREVRESIALGKSVGVSGTPTLFVNGRKIVGLTTIPYETLKSVVQNAGK
jgi:protein-disulfide isomerase